MNHENGSYGGHSGGIDLTGALTRANVEGRSPGRSTPWDGKGERGTSINDNTLHATEGTLCHACGAPLTTRDFVRVTSKGTRHESCP